MRWSASWTSPSLGVNLIALDSRFHTTCCRRFGVAEHRRDAGIDHRLKTDLARVHRRADRVGRRRDHLVQIHLLQVQAQLARHDARHVEQVVDELGLRDRVALDGFYGAPLAIGVRPIGSQQARPAQDRRQRRAQLVRHGGQELVLRLVRGLGFAARAPLAILAGLAFMQRLAVDGLDSADVPAQHHRDDAAQQDDGKPAAEQHLTCVLDQRRAPLREQPLFLAGDGVHARADGIHEALAFVLHRRRAAPGQRHRLTVAPADHLVGGHALPVGDRGDQLLHARELRRVVGDQSQQPRRRVVEQPGGCLERLQVPGLAGQQIAAKRGLVIDREAVRARHRRDDVLRVLREAVEPAQVEDLAGRQRHHHDRQHERQRQCAEDDLTEQRRHRNS